MRIGFTGTQVGLTTAQEATLRVLLAKSEGELHHGDCVGGDECAHNIAKRLGYRVVVHQPDNPRMRAWTAPDESREPKPYLVRNRCIVDSCDELIACPREGQVTIRSGTWATVRYAANKNKKVTLVLPSGEAKVIGQG